MTAPTLTGFSPSITLGENTVNATPQLLDADVTFSDVEGDFDGGVLTLSGLLAEDRVSVRNQGTGPGQIGLSGSDVTYEGVVIGFLSGGVGDTLTITFYSSATSAAIEALIENLTYANVSNTPTTSRTLTLNITDAAGEDIFGALDFAAPVDWLDSASPFYAIDPGSRAAPTFGDLDGDGDLDLVIGVFGNGDVHYFENTGTVSAPSFTQRTGAANPFNAIGGVGGGLNASSPTLADLDGDGDLDLTLGASDGLIRYYENTGTTSAPVFTQRTGGANPFDGIDVGSYSEVSFGDLDGDGDLDAMIGNVSGSVTVYENSGTSSAAAFGGSGVSLSATDNRATSTFADFDGDGDLDVVLGAMHGQLQYFENTNTYGFVEFIERTGTDNPFNGFDVDYASNPVAVDLDNDGDLDLAVGNGNGAIFYIVNNSPPPPTITVTVNSENDAPTATGLPTDVTVVEDVASNLNLSAVTLTDLDASGPITVTLTATAGTMTASSGGGVTVTNSGTGAITLTGTVSAIDTFLNTASAIQYTGALNANGDNAATVTVSANDGSGSVTLGTVNVDITAVNDAMSLTGFASSVTFGENTVNATPQLLDIDVSFSDPDSFDGGNLTLSGLLAEDRVSVRNEGSGAGQIGLSGANVTYGGVTIGTLAGGSGATLTITFNAAATSTAIDALIQNLTYANVSHTPTASRNLVLNVTDAAGDDLAGAGGPTFAVRTGAANPFNAIDIGIFSVPVFEDLDNDGDLDAIVGGSNGLLNYFQNTGTTAAPVFTARTGAANPFNGLTLGDTATFGDLDGDGDLDAVVGNINGQLRYLENTGTASAPSFTERTGAANPFNGVDVGSDSEPRFVDVDGDGDLDAVIGAYYGNLHYFENTGTAVAPVFTQRTGAANPFDHIDIGTYSTLTFGDVDGDGDVDLVVGEQSAILNYFENTGTALSPVFTERTGAANPFDGLDFDRYSTPALADIDGDGDLDVVVGELNGILNYLENTTVTGQTVTVTVTAENDAPTATGLPTDVTVTEDVASNLDLSAVTLTDLDTSGDITVVLTASAGSMTASSGGGVTVFNSGSGAITLTGTVSAIDTFLNTASAIQYTGAANANGDNAATVTVTANDGSGSVTLGTVNVDITAVNDAMSLTGFAASVTFGENTVNATPQLLDIDVTFSDPDSFDGGSLTLSGLLAEDRVSVRDEGTGAGQIGLSGSDVTYGGVIIGTLAGGSGATLTITFNAAATGAAIDALIQNLTYANVSNTPTASRTLTLNVTDAFGNNLTPPDSTTFTELTGGQNPASGIDIGIYSSVASADLDGDGDLDLVVSGFNDMRFFENVGTAASASFVERVGAANPFQGLVINQNAAPAFGDLDGDGDLDAVVGQTSSSSDSYLENIGTAAAPVFVERTGAANPMYGLNTSAVTRYDLVDMDGDGDLDAVNGNYFGTLRYFENTGTPAAAVFTLRTGAANPFDGVDLGSETGPAFGDIDGDGDQDAVVGQRHGTVHYFENTGTTSAPVFVERTGAANPFAGINLGSYALSRPSLGDIDGDGDMDLLLGSRDGDVRVYRNDTIVGQAPGITVTVTAQNDAPVAVGLPTDVTVVEDVASNLDLSALSLSDADVTDTLTLVLTAGAGTLSATSGGGVTVTGSNSGVLTLSGTASDLQTFLGSVASIQYTGAANASGANADTVTVTVNDGSGVATVGTVNIDITAVNDAMSLTGFGPSVTFDENTVNATPQLLDIDVVFTDPDSFTGGALTITGVSADDRYSVRNEGTGAGQIGLNGADVTYGGVLIGTLAGGVGTSLTITFTAAANDVAIDALIQNLTYANLSDTPNGNTSFTLNITDSDGRGLLGAASFQEFGGLNPLSAVSVGGRSHPTFADMDGDGDMDAVIGAGSGAVHYFENTGDGVTAAFTQRTGGANPFNSVGLGYKSAPTLGDLDGDGDLDLVLGDQNGRMSFFENTGTASAAAFTQRTGAANPLNGFDVGSYSRPVLGDLDGDGDLDVISGRYGGGVRYFENTGVPGAATFVERTGGANPLNAASSGSYSAPGVVDLDGDGDLDVVLTSEDGVVRYFENDGGTFTEQTGTDNPFNGLTEGGFSPPAFLDRDGDGDLDAFLGSYGGSVRYLRNNTPIGQIFNIFITAQNDAPTAAGLPSDVTVTEDTASDLDLSATTIADGDSGNNPITVTLTAGAGTMTADSGGGVTVSGSGGGTLILTGTASNIDAFLNTASNIRYTGAANASGNNADTITVTANDGQGSGTVTLGTVNVDITNVADPMSLTGFDPSVTFDENTVNATPQLLDMDVTFSGIDSDFTGGTLTLSGLLAEDRVSVRNEGTAAGEIGLSGANVTYGGVIIGTLAGGSGTTLTITFTAAATGAAIDALIQNLTYANVSHTPTASRDLVLNVTDAAGDDLSTGPSFTQRSGAANPLDGDFGDRNGPALADLDGDGDMDLLVGTDSGTFRYFENTGTAAAASFTERTDTANPMNGFDIGAYSRPTFVDMDGDGDLDVFTGAYFGSIQYFENTGTAAAPVFTHQIFTGPLAGVNVGYQSSPTFADLDGDGDRDAVVGEADGTLNYFENTGTAAAAVFTQRTGAANPFDGLAANGGRSNPVLVDVDGDGDIDLVSGNVFGQLEYFENTGTTAAPVFIQRTGAANPFNGVDVGYVSAPSFADMDGDGDLDIVIGNDIGRLGYVENTTSGPGQTITVTVTAQNDAPTATGLPTDVTVTEDVASNLDLSAVTLTDLDTSGDITVVLTASAGTLTSANGGGVTVTNSGTGAITLTGTVSAIDTFLNTASAIQYTGAANANGDNAATVTVTANDGSGSVTLGTVNVDITGVNDSPTLTGFAPTLTVTENAVNATPQRLDFDVVFNDPDDNFNGGTLTLTGLLAEDRVSVVNEGTGAGQIGLSGATVTFGGVTIGTLSGGQGAPLSIAFNASATSAAVDALIQALTYANVSDTPTETRRLVLNVTDAGGASLAPPGIATYTSLSGAANPFAAHEFDLLADFRTLIDVDGDGDRDLVFGYDSLGSPGGVVYTIANVGGDFSGPRTLLLTTPGNFFASPSAADLDNDGDEDLVVGTSDGRVFSYRNDGAGVFTALTGAANPFDGLDIGDYARVNLADMDGDGDRDLVVGSLFVGWTYLRRDVAGWQPLTGADSPLNGLDIPSGPYSFGDFDNDGDADFVGITLATGLFGSWFNTGSGFVPAGGTDPLAATAATFADARGFSFLDLDGDGDQDFLLAVTDSPYIYLRNDSPAAPSVLVTVTAENDTPTLTDVVSTLIFTEGDGVTVIDSTVIFIDPEQNLSGGTIVVGGLVLSDVVQVAAGGTLTVVGTDILVSGVVIGSFTGGTGTDLTITLSAAATSSTVQVMLQSLTYVSSSVVPVAAHDLSIVITDAAGAFSTTTVTVRFTDVNDAPTLTALATSVTFAENTVNATPQLLDSDIAFSDDESNFDSGTLTLSGLLAEDRVSVRHQGTGAGQIGLSGADVSFGGVVIGTLAGGSGATLTITFNAAATAAAIDALIQNLTYANVSDTPTASRDLVLNVTDAAGADLGLATGRTLTVNVTAQSETLNGTAAGETLTAISGGDVLNGLGGNDILVGVAGVQTLNGGDDDDTLRGAGGNDVLNGGAGSDTADYSTAAAGVSVRLGSNVTLSDGDGGVDTLNSIENATGSAFADTLFGSSGDNVLNGGLGSDILLGLGGNDTLIGGTGAPNTLQGGLGDDIYVVSGTDTITEFSDQGTDTVRTDRAVYTLGSHLENLTNTGTGTFTGNGNSLTNVLTGGSGRDTLNGLGGDDTLSGRGGQDTLVGGLGVDTADYSAAAAAVSVRLAVNATLNDGDGSTDALSGIENVTGSAFNDVIFGDASGNVLNGGLGTDILLGLDGNDTLIGGAGSANTLQGGLGDDTYVVSANDTITELSGQGTDTVQTDRAFFTLGSHLENLTFTGTGDFQGTGNSLANVITGGAGSDTLRGGLGDDTLIGGGGIDYVVLTGVLADYVVTDLGGGNYRIVDSVGGRDGTDLTNGVERVRFATGPTVTLASLAVSGGVPAGTDGKSDDRAEVMPVLLDDDFVMTKGGDVPEVLPGVEDPLLALDGLGLDLQAASPWTMLSVDQDGLAGHTPDPFVGLWDDSGWNL